MGCSFGELQKIINIRLTLYFSPINLSTYSSSSSTKISPSSKTHRCFIRRGKKILLYSFSLVWLLCESYQQMSTLFSSFLLSHYVAKSNEQFVLWRQRHTRKMLPTVSRLSVNSRQNWKYIIFLLGIRQTGGLVYRQNKWTKRQWRQNWKKSKENRRQLKKISIFSYFNGQFWNCTQRCQKA